MLAYVYRAKEASAHTPAFRAPIRPLGWGYPPNRGFIGDRVQVGCFPSLSAVVSYDNRQLVDCSAQLERREFAGCRTHTYTPE